MSKTIKLKKGLDIKLIGEADKVTVEAKPSKEIAIKPTDFPGLTPKVILKPGEKVKRGETLFFDKQNEKVRYVSPVSGTLKEIVRGAKRRILSVIVTLDGKDDVEQFEPVDPNSLSRDEVRELMLKSGHWPFIRQRPLDKVANPDITPKAIFISGFDSAPLAADLDYIARHQGEFFQKGIDALAKLTDGKVNLVLNKFYSPDEAIKSAKNCVINYIAGKHPAGNVGTQIHHFDPIDKGQFVFTVKVQDVIAIGKFFANGSFDSTRIVALTGSEAKNRKYYRTILGTDVSAIINDNLVQDNVRIISGNALTGENVGNDGHLGFYDTQITVLPEGNQYKFFLTEGWLGLGFDKFSSHRLFPTWLMQNKKYRLDTNLNGEERGFVVTGEMDKVMPFDILPMQLIKAIMVEDIEAMENLGIYEVAPEDFALCEYVCTSKVNIQEKIREGLEVIERETM